MSSPSARRAWIEVEAPRDLVNPGIIFFGDKMIHIEVCSCRRDDAYWLSWEAIDIFSYHQYIEADAILCKESVNRNGIIEKMMQPIRQLEG